MKVLHLGKKGNVEKHTRNETLLREIALVDLPIDTPIEEIVRLAGDAKYLIVDAIGKVSGELIRQMPQLKMIHSEGVAYNQIDVDAARENHVYVCNCKGMNALAVAEQTLLLMLGLLRDVKGGDEAVRTGRQQAVKEAYMAAGNLYEIADFKVGLVGFGDIAKSVAGLLQVLGVETYYYVRHQAEPQVEEAYHVKYLPLKELCRTCNMISLHIPVTPQTTNMFDASLFELMPEGSYFINTARGEVVDSEALIGAIQSGKIAKAGLDTIQGEPVQLDNPFLQAPKEVLERVLFSPHIGGITNTSFKRGYQMIWEDILKMERDSKPDHIVNDWM